jgi:hypothetical protein
MSTKTEKRRRQRDKLDKALDRVANDDQVNVFARQHGDYVREGNKASINRGGTPVARWKTGGMLSESQIAAIEYCYRLWDRAGRQNGLVQDLLKIVGQQPSSGWAQQDALDELARFKDDIPFSYWNVFENVCRFDEPAGVAGSKMARDSTGASTSARVIVCFVADLIAKRKGL